jgi:hypothetical protein
VVSRSWTLTRYEIVRAGAVSDRAFSWQLEYSLSITAAGVELRLVGLGDIAKEMAEQRNS